MTLDGRTKRRTSITRTRKECIGLLRASGSFASRRRSLRATWHSRAAARCRVHFGGRCQLVARAVGEATFSFGLRGVPITAVSKAHVVALSHSGASTAASRNWWARSTRPGCSGTAPPFARRCGCFESLSSFRTACRGHRISLGRGTRWRRHRAAFRLTRNAGPLRTVVSGEASFEHSGRPIGSWRTAGVFHVPRFGFRHRWRRPAPLAGNSNVVSLAGGRRSRAPSKGRPTRKWSRRARRSCAILSPRRAAHLQRWADQYFEVRAT